MSLSSAQKAIRMQGIGSSDIGVIAGLSPHSTVYDLWLEKTGLAEPANDNDPALLVGQYLEDGAAQLYAYMSMRWVVNPERTYVHPLIPWAVATPDRLSSDSMGVRLLEIKLPGRWAKGWDFRAEDGLPAHVLCQAQWQMEVTGIHCNDVFAVAGTEPHIFTVNYDRAMVEDLLFLAEEFWRRVQTKTPPPPDGSEASERAIRAKWSSDNGVILPATAYARDLVDNLRELREKEEDARRAAAHVEQQLRIHIGDASGIDGLCTYKPNAHGNVNWKGVALELTPPPELIAKHRGEPARQLRLKKMRGMG